MFKEKGNNWVDHSDKLYSTLMKHLRESHAKLQQNIQEELRKSEQKDKEMMTELQEEVMRLQQMNSKLKKLSQSEDHLHLLQVSPCTPIITIQINVKRKIWWGK